MRSQLLGMADFIDETCSLVDTRCFEHPPLICDKGSVKTQRSVD